MLNPKIKTRATEGLAAGIMDLQRRAKAAADANRPQARGRADGVLVERLAQMALHREGWTYGTGAGSNASRVMAEIHNRFPGLAVARCSSVEGFWRRSGRRPIYVEVSGAFFAKKDPGLRRSDTAHKITSRVRICLQAARQAEVTPPEILLITSHLPAPGTESAGVLLALAHETPITIWVVDRRGRITDRLDRPRLRSVLGS